MMASAPHETENRIWLSLIIPTRGRSRAALSLWERLSDLAERPHEIEVIWVIDEDDAESHSALCAKGSKSESHLRAAVQVVQVPCGLSMGKLNCEGAAKARGDWLMLLNDDVVPRTRHWDRMLRETTTTLDDNFHLLMVNDLDFEHRLSTFPIVSKSYVSAVGGICPVEYRRFRIDDHIYTFFRALGFLDGRVRIHYHPYVVFQHANWGLSGKLRQDLLDRDDQSFRALHDARISSCQGILREIGGGTKSAPGAEQLLASFAVSRPGHRRVVNWCTRGFQLRPFALALWSRVSGLCKRRIGFEKRI